MRRRFIALVILAIVLLSTFPGPAVYAQDAPPPLPHAFFGTVEVNGQPAPAGTVIEARGEGVLLNLENNPITVIEAGKYGGPIHTQRKLVVQGRLTDDQPIEFYVDGVKAQCARPGQAWQDSYAYVPGVVTQLNLKVEITGPVGQSSPTPSPTVGVTVSPTIEEPAQTEPTATPPVDAAQPTATQRVDTQATPLSNATSRAVGTAAGPKPTPTTLGVISKPTNAALAQAASTEPAPSATQPLEQATAPTSALESTVAPTAAAIVDSTPRPTPTAAKVAAAKPNATAQPILEQAKPPETVQSALSQTAGGGSGRAVALWGGAGVLLVAAAIGALLIVRRSAH